MFTDLHNHLLFGIDDGAPNPEASLAMLRRAIDCGISAIVATPHAPDLMNSVYAGLINRHFRILQNLIETEGLPVNLKLGAEVFFSERIFDWLDEPWATLGGTKKYLLFELPLFEQRLPVADFIFKLQIQGIKPILAHPERYLYLMDQTRLLEQWHEQGCIFQINAGSLTGSFGRTAQQFGLELLERHMAELVASDAHDDDRRSFAELTRARDLLAPVIDEEYRERLFVSNPRRVFDGEPFMPEFVLPPAGRKFALSRFFRKIGLA